MNLKAPTGLTLAITVLFPVAIFVLLGILNWDYEMKFFQPLNVPTADRWLGPKLLVVAAAACLASGGFTYLMRRNFMRLNPDNRGVINWLHVILPGMVAMALTAAATLIIVLGPAALTMFEQIHNMR